MHLKRLAALAVAVLLVVAAFVIRSTVDDGDDPTTVTGGSTAAPLVARTEVVCITELSDVCTALGADHPELDISIEDAGTTLDRLAALDEESIVPLWVTAEPFPAMVDSMRSASPVGFTTEALATSTLAVAVPTGGRADVLGTGCNSVELWHCIGDHAGDDWTEIGGEESWRTIRPALGDVEDSALALLSFADAIGGYLGTADYSPGAWEADRSFNPWLRRLVNASVQAPNSAGTPLRTMATGRSLDVAATADYELAALGASGERYELVYPAVNMSMQVVLAVPPDATAPDGLATELATALTARDWAEPAAAPTPHRPPRWLRFDSCGGTPREPAHAARCPARCPPDGDGRCRRVHRGRRRRVARRQQRGVGRRRRWWRRRLRGRRHGGQQREDQPAHRTGRCLRVDRARPSRPPAASGASTCGRGALRLDSPPN